MVSNTLFILYVVVGLIAALGVESINRIYDNTAGIGVLIYLVLMNLFFIMNINLQKARKEK